MKILVELTKLELDNIVKTHLNIEGDDIEIRVTDCTAPYQNAASDLAAKNDVADFLEDTKKPVKKKKRHSTLSGKGNVKIPKEPKLDYSYYAKVIEEFLNSSQKFMEAPHEDGIKPSGLLYRYNVAAEMYGFRKDISLNASAAQHKLIISKKDMAPKEYVVPKKKAYAVIKE